MTHFDEVDRQRARGLLEIASSCHDRAVAVRVRHLKGRSPRMRLLFIVNVDVIFEFAVRSFGGRRPAAADVLVSRWVELVLLDDHRVVRVVLLLFAIGKQQLV